MTKISTGEKTLSDFDTAVGDRAFTPSYDERPINKRVPEKLV